MLTLTRLSIKLSNRSKQIRFALIVLFFLVLIFSLIFELGKKISYEDRNITSTLSKLTQQNINGQRKYLSELIDRIGPEKTYDLIEKEYRDVAYPIQHTVAHILGELFFEKFNTKGVGLCNDSFQFGCYHGFFGSAVNKKGLVVLPDLKNECDVRWQNSSSYQTMCHHGIGHGIVSYFGPKKLEESLNVCLKLLPQESYSGCQGGVFMEYNFRTMDDPSGSGAKARNPDDQDPKLPCSKLDKTFQSACYYAQASWWVEIYNQDYNRIFDLCGSLNQENHESCLLGLAGSIASHSNYSLDSIRKICENLGSKQETSACKMGVASNVSAIPNYKSLAADLCNDLDQQEKVKCTNIINTHK